VCIGLTLRVSGQKPARRTNEIEDNAGAGFAYARPDCSAFADNIVLSVPPTRRDDVYLSRDRKETPTTGINP